MDVMTDDLEVHSCRGGFVVHRKGEYDPKRYLTGAIATAKTESEALRVARELLLKAEESGVDHAVTETVPPKTPVKAAPSKKARPRARGGKAAVKPPARPVPPPPRMVFPDRYRVAYVKTSPDRPSNGDGLARLLEGMLEGGSMLDLRTLHSIARENNVDPGRWALLNPGQQRMNLGNVLRGRLRRGDKITVAGRDYTKEDLDIR
jgi:hypothetical protein